MGDQKDHVTIQKKDVETASSEVETQDFETATESLPPPTFQLKTEPVQEKEEKEGMGTESESEGAFQFALAAPPNESNSDASKTINSSTIQKKGIAEPFRMPVVQKKPETDPGNNPATKPSFKLGM